ncbi:MAG: FadR family transcriptional regulator, partial [Deltaproteobacteria bacterium]|nr:FadR family transcriptional regulator [Deltaproteobacteria bacterium]
MKVQKIRKNLTSEMVIEEILKNVKSGDLQPGDKLPTEREMGRMFGVGRSSIRDQGKGTFVKNNFALQNLSRGELRNAMAAEDIFELMELREILECNAVRLAAERAGNGDRDRINEALEQMKACREDFKRFYKPDFNFHMAIAEATHNKMIYEMIRLLVEKA